MRSVRLLRGMAWLAISALIMVPIVSVPINALVDRSPEGRARLSAFPLALTISDVSVREAIRNSVGLAAGVSLAAMILGVALARVATSGRFRGLEALAGMARLSGSVPPVFGAIGLASLPLFEGEHASRWRWAALAWVQMAWAVPRVMAAARQSLDRVSPSWEDAARMAGASRSRAWWASSWPVARPRVARAVAGVFGIVLIEPSAPLVLGVRRSMGFLLIESWLAGDRVARAASLAAIALVFLIVARVLIVWRGGPNWPLPPVSRDARRPSSPWLKTVLSSLILPVGAAFGLAPLVAMIARGLRSDAGAWGSLVGVRQVVIDTQTRAFLADSAILGLLATSTAVAMAWLLSRGKPALSWRSPSRWPSRISPVLFGLGAAMLPGLVDGFSVRMASSAPVVASAMHHLANAIDPFFSPWIVLVVVVAILRLPEFSRVILESRRAEDRTRMDVALTLGASPVAAWRTIRLETLARLWSGPLARSFAASALDAGPALFLCPTLACRPIAPGLLAILARPDGLGQAASLATAALVAPLVVWIVAGIERDAL